MAQVQTENNTKIIYQSKLSFLPTKLLDFSDGKYESFHLERDGNSIKYVSDGIQDRNKEVQSHAHEAGLVNILKMQELRFGSIDNAIAHNKANQVFADVSVIPTSVAEQAEYVAETRAAIQALCAKFGISPEELLSKDEASIASLVTSNNEGVEGGQE